VRKCGEVARISAGKEKVWMLRINHVIGASARSRLTTAPAFATQHKLAQLTAHALQTLQHTMPAFHASFTCWDRLPTELQLLVLECLLTNEEPVSALVFSTTSIVGSELSSIIGTRNHNLVILAMEACTQLPLRACGAPH
jgi:hypothetical protein